MNQNVKTANILPPCRHQATSNIPPRLANNSNFMWHIDELPSSLLAHTLTHHIALVCCGVKTTLQPLVALTSSQQNSITRPRAVKQLSRTNWKQYCTASCSLEIILSPSSHFRACAAHGAVNKALKGRRRWRRRRVLHTAPDAITATYGILLPLVSMQPTQHPQWFMMTGCCCFRLCWRVQVYNNVRLAMHALLLRTLSSHAHIHTRAKIHKLAQKSVRTWVII